MGIILGIAGGAPTGMGRGSGSNEMGSIELVLSSVSDSISEYWSLTELLEVSFIFLRFAGGSSEFVEGVVWTDKALLPFAEAVDVILNCGILLPAN